MSPCERLSDRMPAVAGGEAWAADERAHLDGCADCSAEWALVRSARALGANLSDQLNEHHVTERVLGRLRAERVAGRGRRRGLVFAAVAAAAALALTVWTWDPGQSGGRRALDVAAADLSIPELDSLRAPELEMLLRTMDRPADEPAIDLVPVWPGDLESGELDGVLEALEG
ncbi:MAG: hypothetical protein ACREOF_03985 [Gemmatimonadales bacterium]